MQYNYSLIALASMLGAGLAHNIQLASHGRECFHEQLHKDDKMTVTFQVGDRAFGGAGSLDIDFWVCIATSSSYFSQGRMVRARPFLRFQSLIGEIYGIKDFESLIIICDLLN